MKSKKEIIKQFRKHKAITNMGLDAQRSNAAANDAYYAGQPSDVMLKEEYSDPFDKRSGQKPRDWVRINNVQSKVDAVNGFFIQNKRQAKYIARIQEDEERELFSKNANTLAEATRDDASANDVENLQTLDMLVKGYGVVEDAVSYGLGYSTRNPNGELIKDLVTNDIGWDPEARKVNVIDRRWDYYRRSFDLETAKILFDDTNEDDYEFSDYDRREAGYTFERQDYPAYNQSKIELNYDWNSKSHKTVWVYFYQWREVEKFYRIKNPVYDLQNPQVQQLAMLQMDEIEEDVEENDGMFRFDATARILNCDAETKNKLEELFGDLGDLQEYSRDVFYKAVLSGDHVFKAFRSSCQDSFSTKFKTGKWDNVRKIWVGMVDAMREPADLMDKMLTETIYTVAANSKGGWFVEEGALISSNPDGTVTNADITEFEENANRTDAVVLLANGGLQKVQPKKQAFTPTGYDAIMQIASQALTDAVALDPSFLGSSENKMQTAQLHRQLVRQVISTYAVFAASITSYSIEDAKYWLSMMREYVENNVGEMVPLIGEDGKRNFMKISEDSLANEYLIDIQEAPQTAEDKEMQSGVLSTMAGNLIQFNPPAAMELYAASVKLLPIDEENRQAVLKALQPPQDPQLMQAQQQIQTLQQQIEQLTNAFSQAQAKDLVARAELNAAKTQQTFADITKSHAETQQILTENSLAPLAALNKISVSV